MSLDRGEGLATITQLNWPAGLILWGWIIFFLLWWGNPTNTERYSLTKHCFINTRHFDSYFFLLIFLPCPSHLSSPSFRWSKAWFKSPLQIFCQQKLVHADLFCFISTVLLPPSSFHVVPLFLSLIVRSAPGCTRQYNHFHFHHFLSNFRRECPPTMPHLWMVLVCGNEYKLNCPTSISTLLEAVAPLVTQLAVLDGVTGVKEGLQAQLKLVQVDHTQLWLAQQEVKVHV